jgi:hypothetical protein
MQEDPPYVCGAVKFAWGSDAGRKYDSTTGNGSRGKGGPSTVGSPAVRTVLGF